MRALLDESLPRGLLGHLGDLEVETVLDRGWGGLTNGELLARASPEFDVFLTADQNLQYQQNLQGFDISVIVLAGLTNRVSDLVPLIPQAIDACRTISRGEVRVIRSAGEGAT